MATEIRDLGMRSLGGVRLSAANVACWSRVACAALFVASAVLWPDRPELLAGIIVLAGVTDLLDGILARGFGTVNRLGAVLDYTADKLFYVMCLLVLVSRGDASVVAAAIILGRDVAVTGMRLAVLSASTDIPARPLGKIRTVLLFAALFMASLQIVGSGAMLVVVAVVSVISLFDYGRAFLDSVRPSGA